jgi:outer membrane protein W
MVMSVKKHILSLTFLLLLFTINAQTTNDWHLKLGTNYAHGFITENTQTSQLQLSVGFEKDRFELRLDGFYMLGYQGDRERFSVNNQALFGGFYYFLPNNIKPYLGCQVGLAYSRSTEYGIINELNKLEFESALNPIVSLATGLDYKLNNRFDLNIECRQIFGKHIANSYPTYLDEFRVSIGIGFYLINSTTN